MKTRMDTNHEPPAGILPTGRFCVDEGGKEVGLNIIFGFFEPLDSSRPSPTEGRGSLTPVRQEMK